MKLKIGYKVRVKDWMPSDYNLWIIHNIKDSKYWLKSIKKPIIYKKYPRLEKDLELIIVECPEYLK